ncbi:MAG: recombinase family protein [candidate division Zixibacteria bacterium]|nr:recombinase family protein [candidate division Zixibacteria bacterium]
MRGNLCAGYCRCSTNMQDRSIPDQQREIEHFAAIHNLKIVRWFIDEGCSGTSIDNRDGFLQMKALVDEGENDFSAILTYDTTRWGRFPDPRESIFWEVHFEKKGVDIIYTNDDIENTKSFQSAIMKTIKHAAAGDYSRRLSVLVTRACAHAAKEGFWNGGRAPYGYKRAEVDQNKQVIRILEPEERCNHPEHKTVLVLGDQKEVDTVRKIFDYYVNKNIDLKTIARKLSRDGIPSPGCKWAQNCSVEHSHTLVIEERGKWTYHSVLTILTRELYTGKIVWGIKKIGIFSQVENLWGDKEDTKYRHDKQNVIVSNRSHPPIISEELYQRAQDILNETGENRRLKKMYLNTRYLLSGMVKCGTCGFGFYGGYYVGRRLKDGSSHLYRYYRDEGHSLRRGKICSLFYIKMEELDNLVLAQIKKKIDSANTKDRISSQFMNDLEMVAKQESDIEILQKRVKRIGREIESSSGLDRGTTNHKSVYHGLINLGAEKQWLIDLIERVKTAKRMMSRMYEVTQEVRDYYDYCAEILNNSPLLEKRIVIRNLLDKVIINKKDNLAVFYFYKVPKHMDFYLDLLGLGIKATVSRTLSLPQRRTIE